MKTLLLLGLLAVLVGCDAKDELCAEYIKQKVDPLKMGLVKSSEDIWIVLTRDGVYSRYDLKSTDGSGNRVGNIVCTATTQLFIEGVNVSVQEPWIGELQSQIGSKVINGYEKYAGYYWYILDANRNVWYVVLDSGSVKSVRCIIKGDGANVLADDLNTVEKMKDELLNDAEDYKRSLEDKYQQAIDTAKVNQKELDIQGDIILDALNIACDTVYTVEVVDPDKHYYRDFERYFAETYNF